MNQNIIKYTKFGLIIGIILAIIFAIIFLQQLQKGFGDFYGVITTALIVLFPSLILGFIVGLFKEEKTKKIGKIILTGGIIGIIFSILNSTCFSSCANWQEAYQTFGGSLFLNDFALGLWIAMLGFILGASASGVLGNWSGPVYSFGLFFMLVIFKRLPSLFTSRPYSPTAEFIWQILTILLFILLIGNILLFIKKLKKSL